MFRAYRYRLYPTKQQQAEINKIFGCCRYAYNYYVREHERLWKEEHRTATDFDLMNSLRAVKYDKPWLQETDSVMLQYTAIQVKNGYRYFFDHINIHPPHERKKGERPYQSYTTAGSGLKLSFRQNLVFLPKLGAVRAKIHRRFYDTIKHATVRLTASGRYYVILCVETRKPQVPMRPFDKDNAVGIDVGIRHFITLSDGSHYEMPDMSRTIHRCAFLQRRLKGQKPGSKGYQKTKQQIARINEHIANIRLNKHHEIATDICRRFSTVCMETINAGQMRVAVGENKKAKDNGFNRKLNHVALGQFSNILETTAARMGVNFARIDRWEPSTKRCHVCGHVLDKITLDVEEWTCPHCGTVHDRDVNAAINIRDKGIEKILPPAEGKVKPAKAAASGDERTGKVTGNDASRPSTQIEEGTALPRLARELAHYVKFKSIQAENIRNSLQLLRTARVKEDSKFGVMEYLKNISHIVRLKPLYQEFGITVNSSNYIYTLKGTPEYELLFHALRHELPAMMEAEIQTQEEKARLYSETQIKQREQTAEKNPQLRTADNITGMAYFVSSTAVSRLAYTSAPLVDNWAMLRVYDNPKPRQFDKIQDIISAYLQIAQQLRKLTYYGDTLDDARAFNLNARKLVQLNKVCTVVGLPSCTYHYIYSIIGTSYMNQLMDYLNITLPSMIEEECQQMQDAIDKVRQETTE